VGGGEKRYQECLYDNWKFPESKMRINWSGLGGGKRGAARKISNSVLRKPKKTETRKSGCSRKL